MRKHNKKFSLLALTIAGLIGAAQAQTAAAPAAEEEASFTVTGFAVDGENPIPKDLTDATLAPFIGQHNGIERLQQAGLALEEVLRERGFGFYRVVLPPQDIGGVIKLQMFKFTLGSATIKGNQVFSNDNILRSLPQIQAGTSPNTQQLARDLAVANENPSKRANVTFKQGVVSDTIDATVDVVDSRTLTGFVSLSNIGNLATGYNRVTAGVSHSNLFDLDHQGTFTYTTSPSAPGLVHQYGGYYRAPMYQWGGIISGYYTSSSVNSGTIANLINVTGRGQFMGVQYTHYFAPVKDYRAFASIALDDKSFLNDKIVTAGGVPLFPNYRSRPITVSYTGRMERGWGLWGYNVDYARNLSLGSGNDSASYTANRAGASTDWSVLRFGADMSRGLPGNWLLSTRFKIQFSGQPLVPGEQFGIGGAQSVRGLAERVLSGDTGFQGNVEFWSPVLAEGTRAVLFYDFGQVRRHNDQVLSVASARSLGAGLRWTMGTTWSANLDYAHVLSGTGTLPPGTAKDRIHFSLNWRY